MNRRIARKSFSMNLSRTGALGASLLLSVCAPSASAQNRFATNVVQFNQGPGGGVFVPANALGGPRGAGLTNGSVDVCTLGVGGSLTLAFDVVIVNGPGADFSVFENGFLASGAPFCEVAYVEVSSNGVDFARFPTRYAGPATGLPGFTAPWGTYSGLTGFVPVLANVTSNQVDPFDPVVSGGEAFDLAALASDPLVVGGQVDLADVRQVRIADVPHQTATDSAGAVIFDNSGATGTSDLDAVAVINHAGNVSATRPVVDLSVDAQGWLNLRLEDPDGFADLDPAQMRVSYNLVPVSVTRLRGLLPRLTVTANGIVLRSSGPILGAGRFGVLSVSAKDFAGQACADQIVLQG